MEEFIQFSAKTKNEAITKACIELGVSSDQLEIEVVPLGLGHVVQFIFRGVQRAGGHFVQQWLPDVREVGVDQGDVGLLALAQAFTQAGRQFQAAGATADNHDAMSHGDIS